MKISVIGSGYVGLVTGACFSEFGYEVVCIDKDSKKIDLLKKNIIPIAKNLDDVSTNLVLLASAIGDNEKTQAVIEQFNNEVSSQTVPSNSQLPLFVSYEANGWTMGENSLANNVAQMAGFETIGSRLGFSGGLKVDLEKLLTIKPDLIELGYQWSEAPALVSQNLWHPALQELLKRTTLINIPDSLWLCGSTKTLDALHILQQAREAL